jgi:hypothetical protein
MKAVADYYSLHRNLRLNFINGKSKKAVEHLLPVIRPATLKTLIESKLQIDKSLFYGDIPDDYPIDYHHVEVRQESPEELADAIEGLITSAEQADMCYELLRMRPLSIPCAECSVVISCGKVDYDKSV